MAFTAFYNMKPFSQLMFSVFVILVSFLVFLVVALLAGIPFFGMESMMNMATATNMLDPETITILKYFQVVQAIGLFIVPPFILAYLFYGKMNETLFLNRQVSGTTVLLVIALMIFASPFINLAGELNSQLQLPEWLSGLEQWMKSTEEKAAELTKAFLKVNSVYGLLFNIFMIAVLPALGEELLFRGVIQRIFTRWTRNHHWGIWISAILFSALHLQFYGFVPRMLLGALFGYLLVWSGSLWLPILAHFINNGFAVIAMYLIDKKVISPELETIGSDAGSYYLAVISMLIVAGFTWQVKKQNAENQIQLNENY